MSNGNVEIATRLLDALEGADFKDRDTFAQGAMLAMEIVDPEIEWDLSDIGNPDGASFSGFEGVAKLWGSWLAMWDEYSFTTGGLWSKDDDVLVEIHITARGKGSGIPVGMLQPQRWTFRDGKIVRIKVHASTAEALEALGLEADAAPALRGTGPQ